MAIEQDLNLHFGLGDHPVTIRIPGSHNPVLYRLSYGRHVREVLLPASAILLSKNYEKTSDRPLYHEGKIL